MKNSGPRTPCCHALYFVEDSRDFTRLMCSGCNSTMDWLDWQPPQEWVPVILKDDKLGHGDVVEATMGNGEVLTAIVVRVGRANHMLGLITIKLLNTKTDLQHRMVSINAVKPLKRAEEVEDYDK